uniref:Uncharacterized protein n=1 Tax=viral metagenome TaxID=1070528 RepID=A0A6C0HT10_9ZZZZ
MFSSRMLNNLFFNNTDLTLEEIQQFMLTKNNCQTVLENLTPIIESTIETNSINILNNIPIIKTPILEKKEKSTSFLPRQQDTLFWCIFIIVNGFNEYNEIQRNYGVVELEIKKKIADYLKDNSSNMKQTNYKITKIKIQEIMSELLTSQKMTSYECLLAMCVFYKINIAIIFSNDKIMTEFISSNDEETPFYILNKDSYGKYKVDTVKKTWKEIQEMKQTRVCLDNYLKPMKSISNYTIPNLEELATKLGVFDITNKYKKQELYELINNTINPVITNIVRT